MELDYRLRDIREDHNLKQKDIANILLLSRRTYSAIENENINIKLQYLLIICNKLKYSMDYVCRLSRRNDTSSLNFIATIDKKKMAARLCIIEKEQMTCPKAIAYELGISHTAYYRYKNPKFSYFMQTLMVKYLAKKYNYSIDWIIGRSNKKYR